MSKVRSIIFSAAFFLASLSAFSQSGYFTGDGGKGKRVLAHSSILENGRKDQSDSWVSSKIKRDIINTLINCSNLTVVNSDEKDTIRKIQKEYESSEYSEDNPVQLGKSVQAKYYITFTTTRLDLKTETYSLSATIYNIETSRAEGGFTSAQYSQGDFISKVPGLAATELLTRLGVKLTPAGRRLIQAGDAFTEEVSGDLQTSEENLAAINAELSRITKEQAKLTADKKLSLEMQAENARMETQKALLLQQQKNESERIERLKKDAERKQKEEIEKLDRDEKKQQEILRLTMEVENKAEKIKNSRTKTMSASQQIVIIEGEKQTLYSNEKLINQTIRDTTQKLSEQRSKEISERKNEVPRKAELKADGKTLTEKGQERLNSDIKEIQEKYDNLIIANEVEIRKETEKTQNQLRTAITNDIALLEKQTYTASSLNDEGLYFRINDWDGTKGREGWQYTLTFNFAGQTALTLKGLLTYEEITGKKIPDVPKKDSRNYEKQLKAYDEFCDTVDSYDSFFRMNVPYLYAQLRYQVEAGSYKEVSQYIIKIPSVEFKNVVSGKTVKTENNSKKAVYLYADGITVDWRTKKQQDEDYKKEAKLSLEKKKQSDAREKKEDEVEKSDCDIQEGRAVFASLIYKFVPGSVSYYVTDEKKFCTVGYILTLPLTKNIFIGGNAEAGFSLTEAETDSEYDDDEKETFFVLSGIAGVSYNIFKNLRLSVFGEAGYIGKGNGYGGGAQLEFYESKSLGVMGGMSLFYVDSAFIRKYTVAVELCF